jgi:hypothetical protein
MSLRGTSMANEMDSRRVVYLRCYESQIRGTTLRSTTRLVEIEGPAGSHRPAFAGMAFTLKVAHYRRRTYSPHFINGPDPRTISKGPKEIVSGRSQKIVTDRILVT